MIVFWLDGRRIPIKLSMSCFQVQMLSCGIEILSEPLNMLLGTRSGQLVTFSTTPAFSLKKNSLTTAVVRESVRFRAERSSRVAASGRLFDLDGTDLELGNL